MDMSLLSSFAPMILSAVGGAAATGAFKGPIQTLNDLWFAIFGYKSAEYAEKKAIQMKINLEEYQTSIVKEVVKIKPANIQEPKLSILGPALEASKYYIEDKELRNMFAKLIAASMDKSKNDILHISFVEIIKQMSPLDAENLVLISDEDDPHHNAICNLMKSTSTGSLIQVYAYLFLGNANEHLQSNIGISLSNLNRLGLVDITFLNWLHDEDLYLKFKEFKEYENILSEIEEQNTIKEPVKQNSTPVSNDNTSVGKVTIISPEIEKGLITLTNYGKAFCSICL
ncbi:DUF4393 domain-containing protein [Acetobacterium tundrae]|uniref:DUF4393 domain-containing protein n=1 Tax=Acetobacterium tundrae TaxID=132932 RepID=A0ABR6WJ36_9FIRM|nr:DUF4393 domain-containing protein [Acetobacterium tundrae]MBC3796447.1 DUF4393 domain-containing protein [Acetobacterium tundrae]